MLGRRAAPPVTLVLAAAALTWSGCGGESEEQARPGPAAGGEASAPVEERSPGSAGRGDGPGSEPAKPSRPPQTGHDPSLDQVQEARRRFRERRARASERVEEIRRIVEQVRSGEREPDALAELRERLEEDAARRLRRVTKLCRQPGAPERICARLREERREREAEEREEREERAEEREESRAG